MILTLALFLSGTVPDYGAKEVNGKIVLQENSQFKVTVKGSLVTVSAD